MKNPYMPRYVEIQQYLIENIKSGEFKEGDMLPTEQELISRFGVSRITVTTALREMVKDGIIFRKQGKGTFVAKTKKELDIYKMVNTSIAEKGYGLHETGFHRILEIKAGAPEEKESRFFRLDPGDRVVRVERLKIVDDLPFSVEMTFLPESLFPGIIEHDLENVYIVSLLKETYGISLLKNIMYAEPVLSDARISKLLEIKKGSPILHWDVEHYDEQDRPVAHTEAYIRGDRAKYVISYSE
jgi:GntR family transcriptional regulator